MPANQPSRSPAGSLPYILGALALMAAGAAVYYATLTPARPPGRSAATRTYHTDIPPDTGAPAARVLVEVFLQPESPCDCSAETALLGRALGALDPARIRVRYHDVSRPEDRSRLREVNGLQCLGGIAVDGKHTFEVADHTPGARRPARTIDLMAQRTWTLAELGEILDRRLRAAYDAKGLGQDPEQFERNLAGSMAKLRQPAH